MDEDGGGGWTGDGERGMDGGLREGDGRGTERGGWTRTGEGDGRVTICVRSHTEPRTNKLTVHRNCMHSFNVVQ